MRVDPVEGRILGVLVEKEMTTPDSYPLTLAAVVAGCNQSTNRDPVMSLDEEEVEQALVRLHDAGLATPVRRAGDRVTKYRHKLREALETGEPELAVLAVLLLRGEQTSGELRQRTDRYVLLPSLDAVESVIDRLEQSGLVQRLERRPGQSQRRVGYRWAERAASREINHAGLTVTDIEEAIVWYGDVFGLVPLYGPVEAGGDGRAKTIFGEGFGAMRRAVLGSSSGAGLELFEFLVPETIRRQDNFEYWKTGIFHICFTCEDVAAQLEAVEAAGGRRRTGPLDAGEGRFIAYCEDPFGNILELTNRSLIETYG